MGEPEMIPIKLEKKSVEDRLIWAMAEIQTLKIRVEALEAKPKGNKQGYPSTGVVWDGQVRLMAKAYGYTVAEIDEMQEAMDNHFLALRGTSKARVSSDWQLNARTWIKLDAKRHGRTRQDTGTQPSALSEDVPDPSPEVLQALRNVLVEPDELERDRQARLVWQSIATAGPIMKACNLYRSAWWDNRHDKADMIRHERNFVEAHAAKLGIPAGAFAWPEI